MKKRLILLLMIGLLAISLLTSCALMRQPWPAGETAGEPIATDSLPQRTAPVSESTAAPATTQKPITDPVTDPDFNG